MRLEENQRVVITIVDPKNLPPEIAGFYTPEEWAAALRNEVSLEDARQALSTIKGSLSDAIVAEREER